MDRTTRKDTARRSGHNATESRFKPHEGYASSKHEALMQLCEEEATILEMLEKIRHAKNKLMLERLALVNELMVARPNMSKEEQDAFLNSNTNSDIPSIHTTANPPTANPPAANQPTANPPSASQPTLHSTSKTSNIYPECVKSNDPGLTGNNSDELSASVLERMVGGDFYADPKEQISRSSNNSSMSSECGNGWLDELMNLH